MGNAGAMGELISDICFYLFKFQLFIYIYHWHVLEGKSKSMNNCMWQPTPSWCITGSPSMWFLMKEKDKKQTLVASCSLNLKYSTQVSVQFPGTSHQSNNLRDPLPQPTASIQPHEAKQGIAVVVSSWLFIYFPNRTEINGGEGPTDSHVAVRWIAFCKSYTFFWITYVLYSQNHF